MKSRAVVVKKALTKVVAKSKAGVVKKAPAPVKAKIKARKPLTCTPEEHVRKTVKTYPDGGARPTKLVEVAPHTTTPLPGVKPRDFADPSAALENHWSRHPTLKTLIDLPNLVQRYEGARKDAKEAEEAKQEARGSLLTSLQLASIPADDKVACMGFEVYYTKGEKGRVSIEKFEAELITRGCPSDILEQAREAARGEAGVVLQVRAIKALDVDGSKV